jgi:hypothetical protein
MHAFCPWLEAYPKLYEFTSAREKELHREIIAQLNISADT